MSGNLSNPDALNAILQQLSADSDAPELDARKFICDAKSLPILAAALANSNVFIRKLKISLDLHDMSIKQLDILAGLEQLMSALSHKNSFKELEIYDCKNRTSTNEIAYEKISDLEDFLKARMDHHFFKLFFFDHKSHQFANSDRKAHERATQMQILSQITHENFAEEFVKTYWQKYASIEAESDISEEDHKHIAMRNHEFVKLVSGVFQDMIPFKLATANTDQKDDALAIQQGIIWRMHCGNFNYALLACIKPTTDFTASGVFLGKRTRATSDLEDFKICFKDTFAAHVQTVPSHMSTGIVKKLR